MTKTEALIRQHTFGVNPYQDQLIEEVRAQHERISELEEMLRKECQHSAEQKLRADQMSQQHSTQAALNSEARKELAEMKAPQAVQATEEMRVCNSDECGWIGPLSETYGYKNSPATLCPECKETTELSAPAHPAEGVPVQADHASELAPPNSLPTFDECALRVENSNFLEKRAAGGGYGPEHDSKTATQLHRFIHEYDDADPVRSSWFLHRLELLLNEVRAATQPAAQGLDSAISEAVLEAVKAINRGNGDGRAYRAALGWIVAHLNQSVARSLAVDPSGKDALPIATAFAAQAKQGAQA